ncbi:MAG: 3'(2'),5'-bisphosphate nucleotidase [Jaaginema sp. PMC 1079.18]|nr:3'(2'),5'-bisphosphate nucleotidase [Jaaginema sp. PMC 1080.18]MEC4849824.1 3'(2'),5'-bisphosphate nucleotidase [Jaaginema sp. PMC 1079.18]MEC4865268.1 3'(2'),5'-bisphosphate nucleotidase [Jaaginema sp. PMC 1078.18]
MILSLPQYEQEIQVAIAAVQAAAQLCEAVRRDRESQPMAKADNSPVTVADFGSQALICEALRAAFPHDAIIAEEDGGLLQQKAQSGVLERILQYIRQQIPQATASKVIDWIDQGNGEIAPRYWTLDPIDGTKGFLRGDQYAIALALIEEGKVKIGILGCPALPHSDGTTGVLFMAQQGKGATQAQLNGCNPQFLQVRQVADTSQLQVIESIESAHSDRDRQKAVAAVLGMTQLPQLMDSQAKYGVVASGDAGFYLRIPPPEAGDRKENIWDHAAGSLLVTEAGGKVTDLAGNSLDFSHSLQLNENYGICASQGQFHAEILAAVASA